jgi:hypothetical protein
MSPGLSVIKSKTIHFYVWFVRQSSGWATGGPGGNFLKSTARSKKKIADPSVKL